MTSAQLAQPERRPVPEDQRNRETPEPRFSGHFLSMVSALWASPQRNRLALLATALVAVIGATAYAQIRLNAWNQPFYNALTMKDMSAFITQLGVFALLAGILLVLNVAQLWLNLSSRLTLRDGLVRDLLDQWLAPERAFRLSNAGQIGANPDQRLQADAQHLVDLTADLGIGLLQAALLLASFIGVLWVLSEGMYFPIAGYTFAPPGYMVWCALAYSGTASYISWRVGRPLIALNTGHYAREAELRYEMVRVSEHVEGIALNGGEANERQRIGDVFATVLGISRSIIRAKTRLTWVTAGYGWFTIVAPILVAAPSYFSGNMNFGELMMAVGAFNQVQQSLRWFVDNYSNIADWRATLVRVAAFRRAVLAMDSLGLTADRIALTETAAATIHIDRLCIAAPEGSVRLSEEHIELKPGEHVLIESEAGMGKPLLFRAIAGLWPWGGGRITRPERPDIVFIPASPFVPRGTLRACITYPQPPDAFDPGIIAAALEDLGLGRLISRLDSDERWNRLLTEGEKHALAIAGVMVRRPLWVVIHDALDVVNPSLRARIETIFTEQLPGTGVLNIGRSSGPNGFFNRKFLLLTDPAGPHFSPKVSEPDSVIPPDHVVGP